MNMRLPKLSIAFCCVLYYVPLVCMGNQGALARCKRALTSACSDLRLAHAEEELARQECLAAKPGFEQLRRLSVCLDAFEITRMHEERVAQLKQQEYIEQQLFQVRKEERRKKNEAHELRINTLIQEHAERKRLQAKQPIAQVAQEFTWY